MFVAKEIVSVNIYVKGEGEGDHMSLDTEEIKAAVRERNMSL